MLSKGFVAARAEQREYKSRKARKKEKRARKDAGVDEVSAAFKVRRSLFQEHPLP